MRLFPVLVRDCDWQAVRWLARLQMRPIDARPLAEFPKSRMDRELANVAREVRAHLSSVVVVRSRARPNNALKLTSPAKRTTVSKRRSNVARG